jgi:molecular chaperone GrpE
MSSKKGKEHKAVKPEEGTSAEDQAPPVEEAQALEEVISNMASLNAQLLEAQQKADEYKDGWQRSLADFQNYKRRIEAEKADTYQVAIGSIIKRYLPVMDDLERALATRPQDLPWAEGVDLIYRKLKTILDGEGITRIEAEGKPFDPNFHEAISQEAVEGVESGIVIDVVQQGYMLGERVIRPATVRVAQ